MVVQVVSVYAFICRSLNVKTITVWSMSKHFAAKLGCIFATATEHQVAYLSQSLISVLYSAQNAELDGLMN